MGEIRAIMEATRLEGETSSEWRQEWIRLSDSDKQDLKALIAADQVDEQNQA